MIYIREHLNSNHHALRRSVCQNHIYALPMSASTKDLIYIFLMCRFVFQVLKLWTWGSVHAQNPFNTSAARLIQAFHVNTAGSHVALRGHNSVTKTVRELFKYWKDSANLLVCSEKHFFGFGFGFFVSDIISGGLLGRVVVKKTQPKKTTCFLLKKPT